MLDAAISRWKWRLWIVGVVVDCGVEVGEILLFGVGFGCFGCGWGLVMSVDLWGMWLWVRILGCW